MNDLIRSGEYFSEAVCEELGNYVYRLIDPRDGETFYVGKGKGNRVFSHVNAKPHLEGDEDVTSVKLSRIHEIINAGLSVVHVIHRHGIPKEAIFEVEAALIDAFPGLSNIAGGHGSGDRGPMHARQIVDKYDLPVINFEPSHKLVLINVNRFVSSGEQNLYNQTRFSWRVNRQRVEAADYVLSVIRGVVKGAWVADFWKPATIENFPSLSQEESHRHAFAGSRAPEDIWDLYVGERGKRVVTEGLRHVQNPVRYWRV